MTTVGGCCWGIIMPGPPAAIATETYHTLSLISHSFNLYIYKISHRNRKLIFLHLFRDLFHNDISTLVRINEQLLHVQNFSRQTKDNVMNIYSTHPMVGLVSGGRRKPLQEELGVKRSIKFIKVERLIYFHTESSSFTSHWNKPPTVSLVCPHF